MDNERLQRIGTGMLVGSTAIVAASILSDGQVAKGLNGVGGLLWFGAAGVLGLAASRTQAGWRTWAIAAGLTAAVAFVAKPTDLVNATAGLGIAGAVAAYAAPRRPILWATLIPALYLPAHIGTAVLKAIGRSILGMESSIRTEPPPTAAIVPFAMVIAAMAGGWVVTQLRHRGTGRMARA